MRIEGEAQALGRDRRARESQHRVRPHGPQQGALARHVRATHDEQPQIASEGQVVGHAAFGGQERVAHRPALETRFTLDQLREAMLGVLVAEAREAGERLGLSDRVDPAPDGGTPVRPPAFDRKRELRRPQQHRADRCEELIAARVEQVDGEP